MIVDLILDRKNGQVYDPCSFYRDVIEYETIFDFDRSIFDRSISFAMDHLENEDVQVALAEYIIRNKYNPQLLEYVCSVDWLLPDSNIEGVSK